jgi:CheY-like chemotaxis protein
LDTFTGITADLPLVAVGVVIWVVAISVAFSFYIPVLRAQPHVAGPRSKAPSPVPPAPRPFAIDDPGAADFDHAPFVAEPTVPVLTLVEPTAASAPPVPAPATPPGEFSVLIVDDNAINRQVLELILDSAGVAHVSVENGLEAVREMEACPHHAVLMDLQMPVMDGFEATRRIRDLQTRRGDAPSAIIVVSANCLEEHVVAGRDAGADRHLEKPISAAALIGELAVCASAALMAA